MQEQRNGLNFKGENIYIGLDVHLKNWSVSIFTEHTFHKTFSQPASVEALIGYLERTFPGGTYLTTYEAGFSSVWLHRSLEELGIKNIVVNPADIPTTHKEQDQKRDALDSLKIARSLRK